MNAAWYQILSLCFGYLSAGAAAAVVLLGARKYLSDRAVLRRVRRSTPQTGAAGCFRVIIGGRRLSPGEEIRVPYEGTMGSSGSCDLCIPARKVHMRSGFFWMESDGLHMVALHRDGFLVDDVPVEPGDEAVLQSGAVLRVGDAKLALHLYGSGAARSLEDPYVTRARRGSAKRGRGEGIGAPTKGQERREKKRQKKGRTYDDE